MTKDAGDSAVSENMKQSVSDEQLEMLQYSGEREVLCGASAPARWPWYGAFVCLLETGHGGPHCSGDAFWTDATTQDPPVVLPLSLAQRILAALEECGEVVGPGIIFQRHTALADELRARLPK